MPFSLPCNRDELARIDASTTVAGSEIPAGGRDQVDPDAVAGDRPGFARLTPVPTPFPFSRVRPTDLPWPVKGQAPRVPRVGVQPGRVVGLTPACPHHPGLPPP